MTSQPAVADLPVHVRPAPNSSRVATRTGASIYFAYWWVDWLSLGGLSILTGIVLLSVGDAAGTVNITPYVLPIAVLVNFPHFSATVYRLYQNPENLRELPLTSVCLPTLLFGAVVAALYQPQLIAPYFVMLYLLWSPYHYSGQTVGLTMVYARRAGFRIGPRERIALSGFVFSTFVYGLIRMQGVLAHEGLIDFNGLSVPTFVFPDWFDRGAQAVMVVGGVLFCGYVLAWCVRERRLLPPIVLLPAATQFVWFVPGPVLPAFWLLIPAFHSLQYLLIALFVQLERSDRIRAATSRRRALWADALRWSVANVIGGVLLFLALPLVFVGFGFPWVTTFGVVWAAVNIHHFFVDGVIWKLREPATAAALTTSLFELRSRAKLAVVRA
jgi:hypothetical protein